MTLTREIIGVISQKLSSNLFFSKKKVLLQFDDDDVMTKYFLCKLTLRKGMVLNQLCYHLELTKHH